MDTSDATLAAPSARWTVHARRLALIAALCLVLFLPLLRHPSGTLYSSSSDLLSNYLPRRIFLVESWRNFGEIPLWSPHELAGMPFVADIQVATFYPPQAILYGLPVARLGSALSWLLVAHLILAGWLMYAYALEEGLLPDAALVAGLGYALSGKWLLHLLRAGHFTTIGLAWLPLVLLWHSQAIRRRSLAHATAAGAVFAMIILGSHPQFTFYAGMTVGMLTFVCTLETAGRQRLPALGSWIGYGAWAAVVAVALAAVQLLPTLEFARFSARAHAEMGGNWAAAVNTVIRFFGPGMTDPRVQFQFWEPRGNFAILWILLAGMAVVLGGSRVRRQSIATLLLFGYAAWGAHVDAALGLHLFRFHARMLLVLGLPLALLAGASVHALFEGRAANPAVRARCRRAAAVVLAWALVAVVLDFALTRHSRKPAPLHPYWYALPLLLAGLLWLWRSYRPTSQRWRAGGLALLAADALFQGMPLVAVRDQALLYAPAASVQYLVGRLGDGGRTLDTDVADNATSPLSPIQPLLRGIPAVRAYGPLDLLRFREFLSFLCAADHPCPIPDTTFRQLAFSNLPLLDLLGVRFLLEPLRATGAHIPLEPSWQRVLVDEHPRVYVYTGAGMATVPAYALYENPTPLPRAFVVPSSAALPPDDARAAMATTDFRRQVLLEDMVTSPHEAARDLVSHGDGTFRAASLAAYTPNRVEVEVGDGPSGWLVLSDVWYPGWVASVDGEKAPIYRANYVFRAVPVNAGPHRIVFTYRPQPYALGRTVSLTALAVVAALLGRVGWRRVRRGHAPA